MTTQDSKKIQKSVFEEFSRIGKAISSPKRLMLLELLSQGERTVEVLAGEAGSTVANTSRHLQVLREARLVETEKNGLFVTYRLAGPDVSEFLQSILSLAKNRLATVDHLMRTFLDGREDLEPLECDLLLDRIRNGTVTIIDVRPVEEYKAGHIPGALSIPLKELEDRISEIPKKKEIVAFCRGPYCLLSIQAVELLRSRGFQATHIEEGIREWQSKGLPVEKGNSRS